MSEIADTIVYFIFGIGLLLLCLVFWGLGSLNGESSLVQKLCTQQQYDFCEAIEQQPEYKLKELEK